jgi:hypothetical protein
MDSDTGWDQRKFWFGDRTMLDFTFDFADLAVMTKQLQNMRYPQGEPVPYSQIPAEFQKEVQKKLEEMRKMYAGVKPGQFGGTRGGVQTPPPPRRG